MKPITLSLQEIQTLLNKGEATLIRPVEPQPDEDGLSFDLGWYEWRDTSDNTYKPPFDKVGDEFFAVDETFNSDSISQDELDKLLKMALTLIHKETKVERRDGVWVWVGKMGVKGWVAGC